MNIPERPQGLPPAFIGKERNVFLIFLFSILSLGIYSLVYLYKSFDEAKRFGLMVNPVIPITSGGAALGFLFIPVFDCIWAVMLWFKLPGLVTKVNLVRGRDSSGWGYLGFLMLIPLVGAIVAISIYQTKMNEFWREERALEL